MDHSYASDYDLLKSKEILPYKFPSSCGGISAELDSGDLKTSITEHYFFFSLTKYLSDPKNQKHEFRFFKTLPPIGKPDFILNEKGLWKTSELICEWRFPYDENFLFANSLKNCFVDHLSNEFPNLVNYFDIGNQHDVEKCALFNVKAFYVNDGVYSYKSNIYGGEYYLDTKDMPDLANGQKFLSKEKRTSLIEKIKQQKVEAILKVTNKIKTSASFKELQDCMINTDKKCEHKFWDKDFFESIAEAGYDPICSAGKGCSPKKLPKCGSSKDLDVAVSNALRSYVLDFILSIKNSEAKNFDFESDYLLFNILKPHTKMGDGSFRVDTENGKLKLHYFSDGLSC